MNPIRNCIFITQPADTAVVWIMSAGPMTEPYLAKWQLGNWRFLSDTGNRAVRPEWVINWWPQ